MRDELAELLRRLLISAIRVTHDQEEAMAIADRLAVMRAGAIVQVGDAESLYRSPAHPFVAEFLGRVNRLPRGEADRLDGIVRIGGNVLPCPAALAAQAELLLRPEDVRLADAPASDGDGSRSGNQRRNDSAQGSGGAGAGAEIAHRVFLGDRLLLHVRTLEQGTIVVDAPKDSAHRPGDRVRLEIDPTRFMRATDT